MSAMKMAIQRVASLKPLVVAGLVGAGLVLGAGVAVAGVGPASSPPTSEVGGGDFDAADVPMSGPAADFGTRTRDLLASDEATKVTVDLLGSGLLAIASTDLSTLSSGAAARTIRDMAARTVDESPILSGPSDEILGELKILVAGDMADVDKDLKAKALAASFPATGTARAGSAALGDLAAAKAADDGDMVRGHALRATLQLIKDAPANATPEGMQAAARTVAHRLGMVARMHAVDVSTEMAKLSDTKRSTLQEISSRISAFREGATDTTAKDLRDDLLDAAQSGQMGVRAADRIVLAALVDAAVEDRGVEDVPDLVSKVADVDVADATLDRIVAILGRDQRGARLDVVKELAEAGIRRSMEVADATASASMATVGNGPSR